MSSNRVPAKQNTRVHNAHLRQVCSPWTSIIPVLVLALGLGGCALNSAGLPGGLPVPPGGGTLTISRSTLMAGITGRTYTIWIPTSGGTGTLAPGGCTLIGGGSLPAGLTIARSDDLPANAALSFCKITGTITTAGPATVSFTLQASDTATPANTASQSLSIVVRPEFAVTTATPFLNGVIGRTYGNAPQAPQPVVTNVSATVGNAPLNAVGGCVFTIAGNPGFNLTPAATGGNTCPLSSGATALTASGPFSVSLAATDSDLTDTFAGQTTKIVVPKKTISSAALTLAVNLALGVTLAQSTNATPTTALLNAVQGRNYGTGAQAAGAPSYAATGGLTTTGNYNWCVSTGALPAGFTTSPFAVAACPTTAAVPVATPVTLTAATAGAAGGPTGFTLLAGDTGNAAVPALTTAATVGAVSNTAATNLTINGLLALAVNLANALPDAVLGRTYGGAGFTSIVYTASFGAGAYTFTAPPTAGAPGAGVFPTPMACVSATPTLTCSSAAITGTAGAYTNAPASVNDAGNAAVPGSAAAVPIATATQTRTLNVRNVLIFFSVNYANPLPDAVNSRSWGTGVGFTPLVYTAQDGLGGYSFAISGTAFPTGIACATAAATFTCDTTVAGTVTGAANPYNGILVNVNDTATVTTPNALASATQPPATSRNLLVNADINLTSVAPDPGNAATSSAVIGRTYGKAPQAPPLYTFAGGLVGAGYAITTPTIPAWMTCTPTSPTLTCDSGVTTAAAGPSTLTVNVLDTANAATPARSTAFADTRIITVNADLSLTGVAPDPGNAATSTAVIARTYGKAPQSPPVYTVTGGLGGNSFTTPAIPAWMTCTPAATTLTCDSGATTVAAGPSTLTVNVVDVTNLTTPARPAPLADTRAITVVADLSLVSVAPDPGSAGTSTGVIGRTYGKAPQSPPLYSFTGGLGAGYTITTPAIPAWMTCTPAATTLSCDSGATTVAAGPSTLTVNVVDVGNTTTPAKTPALTDSRVITVVADLSLTSVTPDPAAATSTAVIGRTYGKAPQSPPLYSFTGGLGAAYTITTPAIPAWMTCTPAATTLTCDSGATTVAAGPSTLTVNVVDTANTTTPAKTPALTDTRIITVNADLSLTGVVPDPGNAATSTAVIARTYGKAPQSPPVYTVSGGLGSNSFTTPAIPAWMTCTPAATTLTCDSGATTVAAGPSTLTVNVVDVANATSPAKTPALTDTKVITVVADLSLVSVVPDPGNAGTSTAVVGRTYGKAPQAPPLYTFTGGLGAGYTITTPVIPAWMTCTPAATTLSCDSGATTVAAGPSTLTVNVVDVGNTTTPAKTPALTDTRVIAVNGAMSVVLQTAPASPNPTTTAGVAVVGRTYGAPAKTNVVYEVSGGLPAYTITPSGTLTTATNIVCTSSATASTCNSGGANVSNTGVPDGVNPSLTISATDSSNSTTPAAPVAATKTDVWTVNPAITYSLLPAPTGGVPNGAIPNAVIGRTYGTPLADLVFTASGGLGNTPGFGLTGTQSGSTTANNILCTPATPQVGASVTVTCNSTAGGGVVTAPAGAGRTLVMTFGDAGNSTTPVGSASTDAAGYTNYSNTVAAALSVALQTVPASPDPTAPAGQAVVGRTYGAPSKTNVVYLVSGGLPAYTITPSGTLTTATNIVCVSGVTTSTCNSAAANVTNSGGVNPSLTISATDTANVSTPAAAVAATKTDVWTVNPVITFSLAPGATGVVPNGAIPDGVVGRQYGTPLGANDLVFTGTGGLGNAVGFGLTGTATGTFVTNSGLICAPATPQVGATATVTCNSGGGASTLGGTATAKTLVMTFSDAGNSTTPLGSTNTDSTGYNNYSNTMAAALAIALQGGSPDPANVNAQAVVGRTYGAAPQAPVVYEASGGLPGYTITRSGLLVGPPANSNICLVPVIAATTLACNSGGVGATGSTAALTVNVSDTANATTPSGLDSLLKTYTINPAVTMGVAPDPASASSTAVIGRAYGVPAGLLSPTYTASNGLGLYSFTVGAPGAGITCVAGASTVVCDSAAITAAAPTAFDVKVTDGANLTTQADAVGATINRTFTVNAALAISTLTLRNGLVDFTYAPTGGPGEFIATTGGLGGNTWVAPGGGGGGCAPAGALPTSLSLGAATGLLSGVPTVASPTPLLYAFDVCVHDSPNTTTPSGNDTVSYIVNIMDPLAAVAQPGTDTVEGINTKTNVSIGPVAMPGVNPNPTAVAVTPDGRKAYVTLNGTNNVAVIDTITGAVTTVVGGLGTCTGPQGIAIGLPGGFPTAFVACSNRRIAVIDASTDTLVSSANYGTVGAAFYGVAFTPDESLVYVTDSANDKFVVLDAISAVEIFGSPFTARVATPIAAVNGAVRATNVVTITTTVAHGLAVGRTVIIAGVTDASFNGSFVIASVPTATTFTYAQAGADANSGGGTATGVTTPHGVVISADGNRVYLAGSGSDNVIVLSTADNTTVVAGPISTGLGSGPEALAVTPDALGAHVYVTLTGSDSFAVFDDTLATPALIGAPVFLGAATSPWGVTIPPLLGVPPGVFRVYIAQFSSVPSSVAIRNDLTPFGANGASPIALTLVSTPMGIAHIPVPR